MSNCNNFIKRVIGVTRTFKWTITTNGAAVPLVAEDLTLQLVPPRGEAVSLPFDVDDNVVSFTWQGEDQHIIGCYSLILWANFGEDNQRRVDIHNFVELIPWSDRQSGEYSDLVEESIELETADFGENIMVVDNLNSTSATDALSANMGRQLNVTKQDVIQDLATIRSGAAAGAAVKEWAKNDPLITDDGTQVSASKLAFNGNIFEQWVPGIASSIGLKGIAGFLKLADISQWDSAYNDRMLPTVAAVKAKLQAVLTALATIEAVIPSQASSTNKLTDKDYVDGAIATNTANFVGTFDTLAELQAVQNPTKNDYGFVIEQDAQGNEYYDRYKYTGTQWLYEYKVESTPFTAEQWAAIQSGITAALVSKLSALPTNAELNTALASKQPVINDLDAIRSGAAAGATAYQKPVSGIPSSDMAAAVQTSLGKADSAYQKPSGGIPKTDLASAVQTSLGKADAAAPQSTTYTKTEVDAALATKQTSSQIATINGSDITHGGNVTIVAEEGQTITIDAAPTAGSNNAVSSGGVYDAVKGMVKGESFNLFNKNDELRLGYIDTSTGKFTAHSSGNYLSTLNIPIKSGVWYVIGSTKYSSSYNAILIAARDGDNNTPISFTGYTGDNTPTTAVNFTYAKTSSPLIFKVDATEPFITFCVKFSTYDVRDKVMLIEGTADKWPLAYVGYEPIIPRGKYDATGLATTDELDAIETSIFVNKKDDATVVTGAFMQTTGVPVSASSWEYFTLSVTAGQKYTISAVAGQSALLWLVFDNNGNRLAMSSDSSAAGLKMETITLPDDSATLYVNARYSSVDATPSIILHENVVDASKVYVGQENIIDYIERRIADGDNVASLNFTPNEDSFVISPFNSTYNIKTYFNLSRISSQSKNPCFNFKSVRLVNRSTGVETLVHSCDDDITPARFNYTYIGANHADSDIRKITCTGHGKTYEDIGSIWTQAGGYFTIVAVIDENTLWMMSNNVSSYPKFRFSGPASGTLTHFSGATHTDPITIESSAVQQFWSSLRVADLSVFADGKKITENGVYGFKHLDICENYDVLNPASVLELIKAGAGTFTDNPNPNSFMSADKVTRHSIVYGFKNAGEWTISTDFIAYQDINIDYFGFTQMGPISGNNRKMYIPKALPISGKDFRQIADYTTLSSPLDFTSEYWENPNLPPDRWMEFSDSIAVHSGFLFDYGVGGNNRKDFVNNALQLYTSLKTYPRGIDSKITVNGGDTYSAVVWRSYLDPANINSNGIISTNVVEYGGKCYVYADFNAAGNYEVPIPGEFVGNDVVVFEKSENVTILSKMSNGLILVKVTSSSPMYGYLVAQIKK